MNSDNLKNKLNDERENLSADEQKICNLIGKLDKVDCPKDFDFHLKARIANADKQDFQPSVWQTLRYILPATAAVLLAAFVLIQAGMFSSPVNQTENNFAATESQIIQPSVNQIIPQNDTTITKLPNSNVVETPATEVASRKTPERRNAVFQRNSAQVKSDRSRVLGYGNNRKPIFPVALDPTSRTIPASGVFDTFGIETEFVGGKIKVKNIREKSLAESSGIKTGDFVEKVDDVKTDEKNQMLKSNSVKKITVSRNGKPLEIRLKTN